MLGRAEKVILTGTVSEGRSSGRIAIHTLINHIRDGQDIAGTSANPHSSRQHLVVEVRLGTGGASLTMVDLAGHETTADRLGATGDIRATSVEINTGLLPIGQILKRAVAEKVVEPVLRNHDGFTRRLAGLFDSNAEQGKAYLVMTARFDDEYTQSGTRFLTWLGEIPGRGNIVARAKGRV